MKAYKVFFSNGEEEVASIVFAKNPDKAKATGYKVGDFKHIYYIDLRANRIPKLDKYYAEGKVTLNWENPDDRLTLVKELGWYCWDYEPKDCQKCKAKRYCETYLNNQEDEDE